MTIRATLVHRTALPRFDSPVVTAGGDLRVMAGADHGLDLSIMQSTVVPGSGPRRHRHPYAEVFVIQSGEGRFEIEGEQFVAVEGDVLIVPPNTWHGFVNSGTDELRNVAIHAAARVVVERQDDPGHPARA